MKQSVIYALILVLFFIPAVLSAASSVDQLKITRADVTNAEDEIVVLLNVANSQNLEALDIPLEFSSDAILQKVEFTDHVKHLEFQVATIDNEKHQVLIGLVNMGPEAGIPDLAPGSGVVAKMYFKMTNNVRDLEINSFETTNPGHSLAWYYNDFTPGSSGVKTIEPELVNSLLRTNGEALPKAYSLNQNMPNPFNPATSIMYALPKACDVKLSVFNILGQTVCDVVNDYQEAGIYTVVWDGKDALGEPVASGVYFYRIKTGDFEKTRKMVLLK